MQNNLARAALISVSLSLLTNPSFATSTTVDGTNSPHAPLSLNSGDSLTVTGAGTVASTDGSTVAVTVSGTGATIDNSGKITSTGGTPGGKNRAIRNNSGSASFTLTNEATGVISSAGSDAFQMNVAGSTVTMYNYGTVSATGSGDQAINWNYGVAGNGLVTPSANVLYNYTGGSVTSSNADAVRLNAGSSLYNSGTIKSTVNDGSSADGIDLQVNNTGATIVNASSTTTVNGVTSANLIEGGRHGITGGQDTDTKNTSTYDKPFTLSVTNNLGGTIKGDNGSGINIDGVDATEVVTVNNAGTITGNGVTGDGDGIDVDGVVNITNSGLIQSINAFNSTGVETSEGLTVGGGTIINSGTIEGSVASGNTHAVGRGITLSGIDHTTFNKADTNIATQKIYATTSVTNSGLIRGDSDAGIAISGSGTGTVYGVTITNQASGTIEGGGSVAAIDGSAAVGGSVSPAASQNPETVINYGTIQEDGTGKAISLGSGVNSVQILGGAASINGDISGGTTEGSNSLVIDPTTGKTFSYNKSFSNFATAEVKSGTVTLSGASTNLGAVTLSGGKTFVDNTTGSGTAGASVVVKDGATLGGSGTIKPDLGKGIQLQNGSTLMSGDAGTVTTGLTLDNTVAKSTILDASLGNVTLAFNLGIDPAVVANTFNLANPDTNSSYLHVLGNTANEIVFNNTGVNDIIQITTFGDKSKLSLNSPYLLIHAYDDAAYSGLVTSGGTVAGVVQDGWVKNLTLEVNGVTYAGNNLYLYHGNLEVAPEPSTWALLIGGGAVLAFIQIRRRRMNANHHIQG